MTTVLRYLTRAALALALAIALLPASPAATGQAPSAAPATTAAPDSKKVLTLADYGPWKRITQTAISDDGKWVTYTYSPNDGDETLFVKQLDGDTLYTIPIGSAGGAGRGGGRWRWADAAAAEAARPCSSPTTAAGSGTT